MDYTSRYGLEFNPFLKNSKEVLVETEQYREASLRLGYLLQTKGFGLLTGGAGRGKTTVIRNWTGKMNPFSFAPPLIQYYNAYYLSSSALTD